MTERVTLSDYHDGADLQMFEVKGMRITVAKVNGAFTRSTTPVLTCSARWLKARSMGRSSRALATGASSTV